MGATTTLLPHLVATFSWLLTALAEQLLAQADRVTAYDELWFAGQPSI